MFSMQFDTDNAAFDDGPATEAVRILREVADMIERGCLGITLSDINGNTIGQFNLTPPE